MRHENILDPQHTALVIIDMQEAFGSSISDFAETSANIALIGHAVGLLDVPIIITEQYPKGLGHTASVISAVLPSSIEPIEKTAFSSCGAKQFVAQLKDSGARQVLVCGIEAHVCVNQTVHDLIALGYQVHLLTDCITARDAHNKELAFVKMQQAGALPSTTEMALFELMGDAKHKNFKVIQRLIK